MVCSASIYIWSGHKQPARNRSVSLEECSCSRSLSPHENDCKYSINVFRFSTYKFLKIFMNTNNQYTYVNVRNCYDAVHLLKFPHIIKKI